MFVFISLEASQPKGKTYRLALSCYLPLSIASVVALLCRLH